MPLILGTNSIKDTGYDVANSCRFNDGDSAYMHKTPGGAGNRRTWTISVWVKKSLVGGSARKSIIGTADTEVNGNGGCLLRFENGDSLKFESDGGVATVVATNAVYRDPSAWMHVVLAVDTTQGTASNRVKIYINGVQETSLASTTYPDQNKDYHWNNTVVNYVGAYDDSGSVDSPFDGYMAEFVSIDGQQLTPTSFGEFNEDSPTIWQPIDVSELTFGTNGFYLDFEASDNLGNDANGGTDLTEVNLAATDQSTDTPTNNAATMDPLSSSINVPTFSEGNLKVLTQADSMAAVCSTIGVANGRWYAECKYSARGANDNCSIGICDNPSLSNSENTNSDSGGNGAVTAFYQASNGHVHNFNAEPTLSAGNSNALSTLAPGDIVGIYMDLEDMKLYFSKNGNLENSTGISLAASTSRATGTGFFHFMCLDQNSGAGTDGWTFEWNFGNGAPYAISSAVADDDGYGTTFEYSPNITGDSTAKSFFALNTKNIAEYG